MPKTAKPAKVTKTTTKKIDVKEEDYKYPTIETRLCLSGNENGPLTAEQAKILLGWETEEQYTARMKEDNPKAKEATLKFGDEFLLKDSAGRKVRCWNNMENRPFKESRCRAYAQDILKKKWRLNLETIIIGKQTGKVVSGQHRLVGVVFADELWEGENKEHWQAIWPEAPAIECLVAFGCDESHEVVRTLDNVMPRSISDTVYTSGCFTKLKSSVERNEASRMLGKAVELLWTRTQAKDAGYGEYRTHSTSMEFLENHKRLEQCVLHLFECNKERVLSNLKLSPGQCAGLAYLMGCCQSDGDRYRNVEDVSLRNEKKLDWEMYEKAKSFWSSLAKDLDGTREIRFELAKMYEEYGDVSTAEKLAVLIKAWPYFMANDTPKPGELGLEYGVNDDGVRVLQSHPTLEGIDMGAPIKEEKEPADTVEREEPSEEEVEASKLAERKKKVEDTQAKLAEAKRLKEEKEAAKRNGGIPPSANRFAPLKPPTPAAAVEEEEEEIVEEEVAAEEEVVEDEEIVEEEQVEEEVVEEVEEEPIPAPKKAKPVKRKP